MSSFADQDLDKFDTIVLIGLVQEKRKFWPYELFIPLGQ